MKHLSPIRLFAGVSIGVLISFGIAAVVIAHGMIESDRRAHEFFSDNSSAFNVRVPDGAPAFTQESIRMAIEIYAINLPKNIKGPFLNPDLEDRGLTIRKSVSAAPIVYIGRAAFQSWGLLGSTLAHEVEIHCRQNFLSIHLQNLAGLDGTGAAEREAYRYELANASRFSLESFDLDLIRSTMSFYYPERESVITKRFVPIQSWIGRIASSGFSAKVN
jgi:hypothetical protein